MSATSLSPPAPRSSRHEFLRGACVSATNIIPTFPLNKLISRQAYEGLTFREAWNTRRAEGARFWYRGIMPPLLQKGVSMGVMYGTYDYYYHRLLFSFTGNVDSRAAIDIPTGEGVLGLRAIAAVLSGSTEGLLTPFERIQTILQHRHYTDQFHNFWDVAKKLAPYGMKEYYRGFSAILLRNGPANAMFFLLRDPVKSFLPPLPPATEHPEPGTSSGRRPHDMRGSDVTSAGDTTAPRPPHATVASRTACDAPSLLVDGLRVSDGLLAAGTGTAVAGVSDHVRASAIVPVAAPHAMWELMRNFFSGAVLGATISTVFYPLNTAKSVMQLQIGGPHRSVTETLRQVYHERQGIRGMFRGAGGNALRSLLSWGIVNTATPLYGQLLSPGPADEQPKAMR